MREIQTGFHIKFDYVNWRGTLGNRKVKVINFYFGQTEYHPENQWLMSAYDVEKGENRIFAMKDMSNVEYF